MATSPPPVSTPRRTIARFMLAGAVGFGVGGALCGLVQGGLYDQWAVPARDSLVATLGFAVMGIVGGAALGLARRERRAMPRFALVGLLGFGVGGLLNLLLIWAAGADLSALLPMLNTTRLPGGNPVTPGMYFYVALMYLIAFLVRGVIGGAVLGLVIPHRRAVRFLSLMGGTGFGLGGVAGMALLNAPGVDLRPLGVLGVYVLWLGTSCTIGGAFLGYGTRRLLRRVPPS
jgi:hypothetical protein